MREPRLSLTIINHPEPTEVLALILIVKEHELDKVWNDRLGFH